MTDTLPFRILMLLPDEDSSISSPDTAVTLARTYYLFRDDGIEVAFASRLGGFSAISAEMRRISDSPAVARMLADPFARDELSEAIPLVSVFVEDFDALLLLVEEPELAQSEIVQLISEFEASKKTVIAVGSATSADESGWTRDIIDAARR
jgi:hypothetical protein